MKRVLSLALVLTMVLALLPLSAFNVSAAVNRAPSETNIALGKTYTVSRTNTGVTSAYHPIKANASLTDGITVEDATAESVGNNTWFALQSYSNTVVEDGTFGRTAEIIIDLGAVYTIDTIWIHFAEFETTLSDGCDFKSEIDYISYSYNTRLDTEFVGFGGCFPDVYGGRTTWWTYTDFTHSEYRARYIKFSVRLEGDYGAVLYGLLDEIKITGNRYENVVENLAAGLSYKIVDKNGKTIKPTRGYNGNLTDGVYDVPVVSSKKNPLTGKYNCNDGKYFGFFDNDATTEQNCPDGYGYIVFDLGEVCEIRNYAIFGPEEENRAGLAGVYYSVDGVNFNSALCLAQPTEYGKNGSWWGYDEKITCRYFVFKIHALGYWGLLSEVQINGFKNGNLAMGCSYSVSDALSENVGFSRGYTDGLTNGSYDKPIISNNVNPLTGLENCNNGDWYGLFNNCYVSQERNNWDGKAYVTVDLAKLCSVDQVKIFFANGYEARVTTVSFSEDGVNYTEPVSYGELEIYGKYGFWRTFDVHKVSARYVRINLEFDGHWCLFNEIQVSGVAK